MELNRAANYISFFGLEHDILSSEVDHRFLANMTVDLRVCIFWDTDLTDVELHVIEPSGEEAYSFNNKTASGGFLSRDMTSGFGLRILSFVVSHLI